MANVINNLTVTGTCNLPDGTVNNGSINSNAGIARSKLGQDTVQVYGVNPMMLRVWDNLTALLPQTAATDDLGVIEGTFGTDFPTVQTSDAKATTVTQYARYLFTLPPEYDTGATVQVVIYGNMITTVSDTTATVDVECYEHDNTGAITGGDLCATSAASINSLTNGSDTFTITATTLAPGTDLDFRFTVAITDGATGTSVIGELTKIEIQLDIRG